MPRDPWHRNLLIRAGWKFGGPNRETVSSGEAASGHRRTAAGGTCRDQREGRRRQATHSLQNAVDPWGDIFATVDLEPALHRHQHAMNHRAKRDRPIVMPPKDVRISFLLWCGFLHGLVRGTNV